MWYFVRRSIDYFDTVPPLLLLIVAFAMARQWKKDCIIYYLWVQFIFNGYANLLNELLLDNLFVYSLSFSWSFFILSLYFAELYSSIKLKAIILSIVVIFQIYSLNYVQPATIQASFDSISFGLMGLLITVYSLLYYAKQLRNQPKENILYVPHFWFVNGIFTYYASNFFIFLTFDTLINRHYTNLSIIWRIHNVVFLVMCIYFFIGLQCRNSQGRFN